MNQTNKRSNEKWNSYHLQEHQLVQRPSVSGSVKVPPFLAPLPRSFTDSIFASFLHTSFKVSRSPLHSRPHCVRLPARKHASAGRRRPLINGRHCCLRVRTRRVHATQCLAATTRLCTAQKKWREERGRPSRYLLLMEERRWVFADSRPKLHPALTVNSLQHGVHLGHAAPRRRRPAGFSPLQTSASHRRQLQKNKKENSSLHLHLHGFIRGGINSRLCSAERQNAAPCQRPQRARGVDWPHGAAPHSEVAS